MREEYKKEDYIMAVYAFHPKAGYLDAPWIYGCYQDHTLGFEIMTEMQESEEYGHLLWSNKIIRVNKGDI